MTDSRPPGIALPIFLAVLFFQLLFASGHLYSFDEVTILRTAVNLVDRHDLAVDLPDTARLYAKPGHDGRLYSKFGIGMSAYLVPWYAGGKALFVLAGADDPGRRGEIVASFANAPIVALIAVVFFLTLGDLGLDRRASVMATLLLVFATPLPVYGRGLFNDALTGLLVLVAFRAFVTGSPLVAGAAAALAALTRAEFALVVPILFVFLWRARRPGTPLLGAVSRFLAAPIFLAIAVFVYNGARFGSPFDQGTLTDNPHDVFSTPLVTGLYGILLSPGKGVLWYAPPLILALAGARRMATTHRKAAWLLCAIFLPILIIHASWHSWMGGWSYGPRRLISLLPILMIPAGFWIAANRQRPWARHAIRFFLVAGLLMQAGGLSVNFMHYIASAGGSVLWSFEHGGAFGQLRYLFATASADLWYVHLFGPGVAALFIAAFLFLFFASSLHVVFRNAKSIPA